MGQEILSSLRLLMRDIRLLNRVDLFQRGIPALNVVNRPKVVIIQGRS